MAWTTPGSAASQAMWLLDDGLKGFNNGWPRSAHNKVRYGANGFYYVKSGSGRTYTWAATIYGIGIQAETDHSTDTWQEDDWGTATRHDVFTGRRDGWHWAWGSNALANILHTPRTFYNY